jgi:hypothetical protein
MEGNIEANRKKGKTPNKTIKIYQKESDTTKEKRAYNRNKPLKYATEEERKKTLQLQKNESGKLKRDTKKYGLEKAIQIRDEKRQKNKEEGNNWFSGLTDTVVSQFGKGITEKNIIFSNIIMPKKEKKMSDIKGKGGGSSRPRRIAPAPPPPPPLIPTHPDVIRREIKETNRQIQNLLDAINDFTNDLTRPNATLDERILAERMLEILPLELEKLYNKIDEFKEDLKSSNDFFNPPQPPPPPPPTGAVGLGLKRKNKKVCSECGMKNCDCDDDEDMEGMGLYASGSGLYASGGQPSRGRGIKHVHHYHTTEMCGNGMIKHHHHHMEGGKITMKSIGSDIKKAFSPVQKAFEPVKEAFEKVEQVATPYNLEVVGHYALPAIGSAVGGVLGSVGGPVGGVIGSAGGSYGGYQLQKELGYDDNKTFQGFGMKRPAKGSQEAKDYMRKLREMRGKK